MPIEKNSISKRLVVWILLVILPITIFIIFENLYAINVVKSQVSKSNQESLKLYAQQITDTLTGAEKYLANLAFSNERITESSTGDVEYERYMQSQLLMTDVSEAKIVYPQIDGFFVVSINNRQIIKKTNTNEQFENVEAMRLYLSSLPDDSPAMVQHTMGRWFGVNLGEGNYLMRLYRTDDYIFGAWVKLNNLLAPLTNSEFAQDKLVAMASVKDGMLSYDPVMLEDEVMLNVNENTNLSIRHEEPYIMLSEALAISDLHLVALIREKGILEGLDSLQMVITVLTFLTLLIVPISLYLINKNVISPLNNIVKAMKKAKKGDMEVEITHVPPYSEYIVVKDTFKEMLEQIKKLRIDVYEEQLQKQRAQLQYYQLQINPHFLMNALNIIYGLAEVKKFQIIQDMTLSLVRYFRSLLVMSKEVAIELKQEIDHVKNYLQIQTIRFPDRIQFKVSVDSKLDELMVPPMMIQSFVENAIKYGTDPDRVLQIDIEAYQMEDKLVVHITDNGDGFPTSYLENYNNRIPSDFKEGGIGIMNVVQRLGIIYHDDFEVTLSNPVEGGAKVSIKIPTGMDEESIEVANV